MTGMATMVTSISALTWTKSVMTEARKPDQRV